MSCLSWGPPVPTPLSTLPVSLVPVTGTGGSMLPALHHSARLQVPGSGLVCPGRRWLGHPGQLRQGQSEMGPQVLHCRLWPRGVRTPSPGPGSDPCAGLGRSSGRPSLVPASCSVQAEGSCHVTEPRRVKQGDSQECAGAGRVSGCAREFQFHLLILVFLVFFFLFVFWGIFEPGSYYVARRASVQGDPSAWPRECWDYWCAPPGIV